MQINETNRDVLTMDEDHASETCLLPWTAHSQAPLSLFLARSVDVTLERQKLKH